jgi:hypothetical protein
MIDAFGERIDAVRARIAAACQRSGRDPSEVALIGITKTHPPELIAAAHAAGLRDFGENRVQEAAAKIEALRASDITPRWHLVGHLQRNKVTAALMLFDILHSVDSLRLAEAIDARAERPVPAFIEVNVAGEASKFGVAPGDVKEMAAALGRMRNIDLRGLMTVAPQVDDPELVRPVFRQLREMRDGLGLSALSMGMTDDFEVAVEEGSTHVRVGRAIFGARGEGA